MPCLIHLKKYSTCHLENNAVLPTRSDIEVGKSLIEILAQQAIRQGLMSEIRQPLGARLGLTSKHNEQRRHAAR